MKQKTITVRIVSYERTTADFVEFEFPKVNKLLDEGWIIKDVFQERTEGTNTSGYFLLTFLLQFED